MSRCWAVAALWGLILAAGVQAAPLPLLHLVDDRGKAIGEPLDLCFQVGLRSDCRRVAAASEVRSPETFYSLRVEGEDHGPLVLRREELEIQADGSYRIAVARKAWLRIETGARQQPGRALPPQAPPQASSESMTVSLYSTRDPSFREPLYRASLAPDRAEVKIPAGEFVVSLARARQAPDLHRLQAAPAARVRLAYVAREGWSLVARYRAAATRHPVGQVEVKAAEVFGYGQKERPIAESVSGPDGLVLLSGLKATMASLAAHHPEFIPSEVQGLSASPGTFAFREVDLALGGHLAAHVTVHGRPLSGARCEVYALATEASNPKEPYRKLWAGKVDPLGVCRSDRLAQGVYKLRVLIPDSTAQVNRWVSVPEAQDKDEDVALAPTRITGEVRRGGRPVPGYSVEASLIARDLPKGARGDTSAVAASDEAGRYELTLWLPGGYALFLRSPAGASAAGHKELTTEGEEERKIDFDLDAGSFRGRVVDEGGRPVEKATVALRWAGVLVTTTDSEGRFELDVQGEDTGTLTAYKAGYRESDPMEIPVAKDAPIPPVTLVLRRKDTARGTVLSVAGGPVGGAWVASVASTPETGPIPYRNTRTEADGSFEVEAPPGPARLFVSGPGCPLSAYNLPALAPPDASDAPALRCPELPAALELLLVDERGDPLPHAGVILVREGSIVPQAVLTAHLRQLGLPAETDGTGHLILAGLAPGSYDLFLNTTSSESTIAAGWKQGFLTSVNLPALETSELQLTLPRTP